MGHLIDGVVKARRQRRLAKKLPMLGISLEWDRWTIPEWELKNSAVNDPTLIFAPNSPNAPLLREVVEAFIQALTAVPLPKGFRPPIATGPVREADSRRNAESLLANLLAAMLKDKPTLAVSMAPGSYSNSPLTAGIINLVKLAAHRTREFLALERGFRDPQNEANSRVARIQPIYQFQSLLEAIDITEDDIISIPHEVVTLRTADKRSVPRKQWPAVRRRELKPLSASIRHFNRVIAASSITYIKQADGKRHLLYPVLQAIYSGNFKSGGRLYTARGGHQGLSKEERGTLQINGLNTTELDFSGMQPRMMYHRAGSEFPMDCCPYLAVLDNMDVDSESIVSDFPETRDEVKCLLLSLTNGTGTFCQAVAKANFRLFHAWMKLEGEEREEAQRKCKARITRWCEIGLLLRRKKPSCRGVMKAIQKTHRPIAASFLKGVGLKLQNIDAQIAVRVLRRMMPADGKCIPCLPIHDSFVTIAAYDDILHDAMRQAYREVMREQTGRVAKFDIPIK